MKKRPPGSFAERLTTLRRTQGLTQQELGERIGVSKRVIVHYETGQSDRPAGPLLVGLAQALRVTTDELLGLQPVRTETSPKTARLMNRLKKVAELPPADQRTILKMVDTLAAARSNEDERRATTRKVAATPPQRATAKRTRATRRRARSGSSDRNAR